MNTKEIKMLLDNRNAMLDLIHNCKNSINEISLSTVHTISLSDLKDSIDFEKFPELEYLFSQENISYLRPYHGELMGLEDSNLGIACRELLVAEIACLLGLDLTGRHCAGICGLTDKRKIQIAENHLKAKGVKIKTITYLKDVLDIRLLWANNIRKFNNKNNIKKEDRVVFEGEDNSLLVITQSEQTDGQFKPFSYRDDVYDLLYPFLRDLGNDLVISDEILDEEYYNKIEVFRTLSLEEAIKQTIEAGFGFFEENSFYFDKEFKEYTLEYEGDKEDIDTFVSFVANKMKDIENNMSFIDFLLAFADKIHDVCAGTKIPELDDFMMTYYAMQEDDYYEYY